VLAAAEEELENARRLCSEAQRDREQRDADVRQLQAAFDIATRHAEQERERHVTELEKERGRGREREREREREIEHVRGVLAQCEEQLCEFELKIEDMEEQERVTTTEREGREREAAQEREEREKEIKKEAAEAVEAAREARERLAAAQELMQSMHDEVEGCRAKLARLVDQLMASEANCEH
jgi:chromosome segregation ATPase